jgi:hypothetical protein
MGGTGPRCPHGICDCFIDTHPENPGGLYPEDFEVSFPARPKEGEHVDTDECPF